MKRNWKFFQSPYWRVFGLGVLTSFCFFLPFLIYDQGLFLYYGDFNVQQIPFYRLAHDAVLSGDIGWNWNTDLGVNFVGSYTFYLLGSPFFWLTLLFPSGAVPYLMAPLLMLKFGLTGVTSYAYIRRFSRTDTLAMLGALSYAFCGFNIYNIFFNHFNEVVVFFPLLLLAMEEFMVNNRRGGFVLAVAACALVNYYFFFGEVLFCLLYFFIRCRTGGFRFTWKKFGLLALESVLGVLLAAVLLLPSFWAVISNPRAGEVLTGFDLLLYNHVQRYGLILSSLFFPPDIPARPNFFPDSNAKWSSVSLFLPVFSVTGALAFFRMERSHWVKKLLTVCLVIALVPGLNAAFSLMNYSYYARWFFMPLLLMALAGVLALEREETDREAFRPAVCWTAAGIGIFALIGVLPKKVDGKLAFGQLPKYPERLWIYVILALIGLCCFLLLLNLTTRHPRFFRIGAACICGLTVIYSSFMIYTGKLAGDTHQMVAEQALHGAERLTLDTSEFFRIDTFDEMDNLGMFWKIPTINAFHSVVPSSIMEYYDMIGGERGVASRPKPSLSGVRGLLSVRYAFVEENVENPDSKISSGFVYLNTQNGFRVYENAHFVPMGFTYDYAVSETYMGVTETQADPSDSSELQAVCPTNVRDQMLLKAVCLKDKDLERFAKILPEMTDAQLSDLEFNSNAYYADCAARADSAVDSFEVTREGFRASSSFEEDELVFFSVPYERGWSAFVNGAETEIVQANGGFMAVYVPGGSGEIEFVYRTPGLAAGLLLTLLGALLFAGYWFWSRTDQQRHPEERYQRYAHRADVRFLPVISAQEAYLELLLAREVPASSGEAEEEKEE